MAQEKGCQEGGSCRRKAQADRQRFILQGCGWPSSRMRMRGALAPRPAASRPFTLATAARQRCARGLGADGRDLCGTGPGRRRTKVAGLKGSSGSSLGSGVRISPEGLVPRHGLTESKRGARAPGRVGGRGARGSAVEGEAGPGTWDPPEPIRPDPGARGLQGPRP